MKTTTLMGMVVLSTLLGGVLVGDRFMAANAEEEAETVNTNIVAETEPVGTNVADSVETNLPPLNTLLGSSLPDDIDPASPLGQLVRLVQAGVEQSVVLAYIQTSPRFFELDADDIIYLSDLGTPGEVIEAVMAHDQRLFDEGIQGGGTQPEEAVEEAVEGQPPAVTVNEFYDTLSPYGTWVYIEGYGRCWRPTVVVYNANWRPYCDNGRWVYTDRGWYWVSNYSWGWATFHYGRWFHHASYGWCWWPDTVWAPSWVCWRYDNDYCGWAPLPPHTIYRTGVGLVYCGSTVRVGFGFNLGCSSYTFVSIRNFCDPNPRRYCVDRKQCVVIYDRTRTDCRYEVDPYRRTLVNRGLPVAHISKATQREIKPVSISYSRQRLANRQGARETLARNGSSVVVNHSGRDSRQSVTRKGDPGTRPNVTRSSTPRQDTSPQITPRSGSQNTRLPPGSNRGSDTRNDNQSRIKPNPATGVQSRPPSSTRPPRSSVGTPRSAVPPARTTKPNQNSGKSQPAAPARTQVRQSRDSRPAMTVPPRNNQVAQERSKVTRSTPGSASGNSNRSQQRSVSRPQRTPAPPTTSRGNRAPRNALADQAQ